MYQYYTPVEASEQIVQNKGKFVLIHTTQTYADYSRLMQKISKAISAKI